MQGTSNTPQMRMLSCGPHYLKEPLQEWRFTGERYSSGDLQENVTGVEVYRKTVTGVETYRRAFNANRPSGAFSVAGTVWKGVVRGHGR